MLNSQKIERWLGKEAEVIARLTQGFYGPPIPIVGTPWSVRGGDYFKNTFRSHYQFGRAMLHSRIGGFTSLSDLIAEATAGKRQAFNVNKVGVTGYIGACSTLWFEGNMPSAGAIGAALSSNGTNCSRTTTGALGQTNAAGGDTLHLISAFMAASVSGNTLFLYDRLWHGAPAMSSSAEQTFTMTPDRYATTTSPGNFAFMEVQSALSNAAHNHTIEYTDQDGNAEEAAPACAGIASCIAKRFDQAAGQWFIPLNSGDTGLRTLTSYTCSASNLTGALNLVLGHPLCFIPCPVANYMSVMDGINSAFNFVQVLDGACVAMMEFMKPVATATTYNGQIIMVSG